MNKELWKAVVGREGLYEVSDRGRFGVSHGRIMAVRRGESYA